MARTALAWAFLLTLLAAPAHALVVTSGRVEVNGAWDLEPGALLVGDNFLIRAAWGEVACRGSIGPSCSAMPLDAYLVVVDGITYATFIDGFPCCTKPADSVPTFQATPFTTPTPLGPSEYAGPYSTPFTMTGHIGPGGFDVEGQGIFSLGKTHDLGGCTIGSAPGQCFTDYLIWRWDFQGPAQAAVSAPEPSTLVLLALALLLAWQWRLPKVAR